jgi:hypothetical protein
LTDRPATRLHVGRRAAQAFTAGREFGRRAQDESEREQLVALLIRVTEEQGAP